MTREEQFKSKTEDQCLREYVDDLFKFQDALGMTDWEKDFVSDMNANRTFQAASAKQKSMIVKLAEKYL